MSLETSPRLSSEKPLPFGQCSEMRTRRHINVKMAINCSANFDATVISLFKIVSDNKINNSSRRSQRNVGAAGISHISVNLEGDLVFGSQDPLP